MTTARCVNRAGAYVDADSAGIRLDVTAPATIWHGGHDQARGVDAARVVVSANTSTIAAAWSGFHDPVSPIVEYDWSVGTSR